jgi:hypothetical protein
VILRGLRVSVLMGWCGGRYRTYSESSTTMPFKSKAQRRKFAELLVKGEISEETFEEWNRSTGSTRLPERVQPKRKSKKKSPARRARSKKPTRKKSTRGTKAKRKR